METVAVSKRNRSNKGNKENAQPGGKPLIKRDKRPVAPFQMKSNEKEVAPVPLKAKPKQLETKSTSGDALKKVKTVKSDGKETAAVGVSRQQTYSRAFLTEQAAKHRKIIAEAPKQQAVMQAPRLAPGMYKGKIVQSKIGAIWKSTTSLDKARVDPSAPKTGRQRVHSGGSATLNSKPKNQVRENRVNKPPVSSTISRYRLTTETTEEKRAKLAEWLASKGKTLKRPVLTTAAPQKTKAPKPTADAKSESRVEPPPAAQSEPETQLRVEAHEPEPAAADCADTQEAAPTTCSQTPMIMNTTLELLEDSEVDLSGDPQDSIDDIVVNLCVALEEMVTPSMSSDDVPQDECKDLTENGEVKEECKKEEVMSEVNESDQEKVETEEEEEEDDEGKESEDASVVKYNVKTTPYLQSVRKTIQGEITSSKRKSNIKDLKFLTPVRRSTRIQRKSSHLPAMLVDHDPCVSSLAELMNMGDDPNAYICRKNPALLDDLPGL